LAVLFLLFVAPGHAAATTKKTAKNKAAPKKHPRPAVLYFPLRVREAALQSISQQTSQSAQALEGVGALVPFFEQLSHPPETGWLHILQFGDSHTASDDWAQQVRGAFQGKFGSGGPGFTFPGHPFLGYRRFDSHGSNSRGWSIGGAVTHPDDGIDGLCGVSLTARSSG
jgi:hypothetical protein